MEPGVVEHVKTFRKVDKTEDGDLLMVSGGNDMVTGQIR